MQLKNIKAKGCFVLIVALFFSYPAMAIEKSEVIKTYIEIAHSVYQDSLLDAIKLQKEIRKLVSQPSTDQLSQAKHAWKRARIPYSQSEVFRFGNPLVDDWEGNVNAWPLDEGLIDYVVKTDDNIENGFSQANVIANSKIEQGDIFINARKIDSLLLNRLHSVGDLESNVALGYHAVEFLLWGQDINGTDAGAGNRPYTDFDRKQCTNGNCFRRARYLQVVVDMLVRELTWMTKQWEDSSSGGKFLFVQGNDRETFDVGLARNYLLSLSEDDALSSIIRGMGSLAYGELAGERIKLGLIIHDPEEEQDCFSDNTHWSHFYNLKGIYNIYNGKYKRSDGGVINGVGLSHLLKQVDSDFNSALEKSFVVATQYADSVVDSAEVKGVFYDQLLAPNNTEGHRLLNDMVDSLRRLTTLLSESVRVLNINDTSFDGFDESTEAPESNYFQ